MYLFVSPHYMYKIKQAHLLNDIYIYIKSFKAP